MAPVTLVPFPAPVWVGAFASLLSSAPLMAGIVTLVGISWLLYTAVAVYHWFRYSHASWVAIPAIFLHLAVSLALLIFALSATLV